MVHIALQQIICNTFDQKVGRWQSRNENRKALSVIFDMYIDYHNEEGFRQHEMLIYGEVNYVGVYIREFDRTLPDDTDVGRNPTEWYLLCYHDCCWQDSIGRYLFEYRHDICTIGKKSFSLIKDWYEIQDVRTERQEEFKKLRKLYRNGERPESPLTLPIER